VSDYAILAFVVTPVLVVDLGRGAVLLHERNARRDQPPRCSASCPWSANAVRMRATAAPATGTPPPAKRH
jgi:hypothetical protein